MSTTYRSADVIDFLRLKQHMVASDHDAIFSDGRRLLVYIYERPGQPTKLCVEDGPNFFEAKLLPGFVRLELQPETRAQREAEQAEKLAAEAAIKPRNFVELKAEAERQARQAANERYRQRRAQQGIEAAADSAFATASHKFAQEVAKRKGQSR